MLIATWNINSVNARIEQAVAWLKEAAPDVVCLQEIKCEDAAFPVQAFADLGYMTSVHGQKTYNGVAILSRDSPLSVSHRLPDDDADEQARFTEAVFNAERGPVRVCCLYLPNGNPAPGPKYDYKLSWMKRLRRHAQTLLAQEEAFVLTGDFNVIPAAADARFPDNWKTDALFLPETRDAFVELSSLGLTEAFRMLSPLDATAYTFWDYQAGAWQKNNGIRIDHALLSPQAADRLVSVRIDAHVRGWEKPSDHVPVMTEIA
jgi:exodeoxyribonuclease III